MPTYELARLPSPWVFLSLKLMKDLPNTLFYISQGDGQVINNTVTWKQVNYNIQLADNNKDIVVTPVPKTDKLARSIYVMARMTVSGDSIIKKKITH